MNKKYISTYICIAYSQSTIGYGYCSNAHRFGWLVMDPQRGHFIGTNHQLPRRMITASVRSLPDMVRTYSLCELKGENVIAAGIAAVSMRPRISGYQCNIATLVAHAYGWLCAYTYFERYWGSGEFAGQSFRRNVHANFFAPSSLPLPHHRPTSSAARV